MVSNEMKYKQMLVPTPTRQMQFAAAVFGGPMIARAAFSSPTVSSRAYHLGMRLFAAEMALAPLLPALGSKHKVGIRYGWSGEWVRWDQHPMLRWYSMPSTRGLPVPEMGWGPTSVPIGSSRLVHMKNIEKSRVGSITSSQRYGTFTPSTKGGPSAQKTRRAQGIKSRGRTKSGRERPWCRVHQAHHWCQFTR